MRTATWKRLDREYARFPRARGAPAAEEEIASAEREIDCVFHRDYREFLRRYGSGMVGPDPIYGVHPAPSMGTWWSVVAVTRHFRDEGWPGVDEWYVISGDGRGNPIGMDTKGRVWLSDHDVGDIALVAPSFEANVKRLFKLARS